MKKFFYIMLEIFISVLVFTTFVYSTSGFIQYMANIEQNAFSFCEMVICLYCATSILLKAILVKRSSKTSNSNSGGNNFNVRLNR